MKLKLKVSALLGIGVIVAFFLPRLVEFVEKIAETTHKQTGVLGLGITSFCRILWVSSFLLNLITVSLPGRFDGQAAAAAEKRRNEATNPKELEEVLVTMPWITLFEPAPWAFSIWGVIYSSELLLSAFVGIFVNMQDRMVQKSAPYWLAGSIYQSLWCLSFRPQFRPYLWLPMLFLAAASASFFGSHQAITSILSSSSVANSLSKQIGLYLCRFPISLHATWLAAAALLNLNAWVKVSGMTFSTQTFAAFFSAIAAFCIGAGNERDGMR